MHILEMYMLHNAMKKCVLYVPPPSLPLDHCVGGSNPLRGMFVINFTSSSPALNDLAQFSLNNVHKGGIKQHHFIPFPTGPVTTTSQYQYPLPILTPPPPPLLNIQMSIYIYIYTMILSISSGMSAYYQMELMH